MRITDVVPVNLGRFDKNPGETDGVNSFNLAPGQSHAASISYTLYAGSVSDGTPAPADGTLIRLTATATADSIAGSTAAPPFADISRTITVLSAPVVLAPGITSATAVSGTVGVAFTYQITASNDPASYNAGGLPGGLVIDPSSGVISGTPTSAGTFAVTLSAINAGGTGTANLTLVIAPVPMAVVPVVTATPAGDGEASEGGAAGKATVRRTGDATAPLTIRYKVVGGARAGTDYKALPGTVTIPAGASAAKIKIKPLDNLIIDGTRVAKIKLLPSLDGSYTLGTPAVVKIKILDND